MKNPVSILLISVHLIAYTNIVEVFKFPNLIRHYQEHHVKNKSVGFIDFLMMHYGKNGDGDPRDDKEDMKLPFKTMDIHIVAQGFVAPEFSIVPEIPEINYHHYYNCFYSSIIPSAIPVNLFRPPINKV